MPSNFFEGTQGKKRLIACAVGAVLLAGGAGLAIAWPRTKPPAQEAPVTQSAEQIEQQEQEDAKLSTEWLRNVDRTDRLGLFTTKELAQLGDQVKDLLKQQKLPDDTKVTVPVDAARSGTSKIAYLIIDDIAYSARLDDDQWALAPLSSHVDGIDDHYLTSSELAEREQKEAEEKAKAEEAARKAAEEAAAQQEAQQQSDPARERAEQEQEAKGTGTTRVELGENPTVGISEAGKHLPKACADKLLSAMSSWDKAADWKSALLETDSVATKGTWTGFVLDLPKKDGGTRFTQVWWDSATDTWSAFDFTV